MNKEEFIEKLKDFNISVNKTQLLQFDKYQQLLYEWNQKINLTGITEYEQVYLKHFYDSATLCKVINLENESTLCDVGTGAGFPGIVLKILFPNLKVTLVDSLEKRIKFLNLVIKELDLKGIETVHYRAEEYAIICREKYDIVTARAVSKLNILLEYCIPMVKTGKYFIPLKANISQEINDSQNALKKLDCEIEEVCQFNLPIENSARTILKIKKVKKTNKKYPRKYSDIKKRPL